jgi:hypothetical protein
VHRTVGLVVIGALALLTTIMGAIALPLAVQAVIFGYLPALPAGTEVVGTKEQFERAAGFPLGGALFLISILALATAIFVVALRWPRSAADPDGH